MKIKFITINNTNNMRSIKNFKDYSMNEENVPKEDDEKEYSYSKIKINGLDETSVGVLLTFMNSKLSDEKYIRSIEGGGNDCNMSWMEDGMDIGGEDMVHELFEIYGEENDGKDRGEVDYTLKIDEYIFRTWKSGEDWYDEYDSSK